MKYLLADATMHKARVHQLDLNGAFLQSKLKYREFVNWAGDIQITFQNIQSTLEEP